MRSVAKKKSKSKSGAVGGALGRGLAAVWRFIAKILGNSVRFIARGARDLDPAHQRDGMAFLILILALVATAGTWFHADNIVGRAVYAFIYGGFGRIGFATPVVLIYFAFKLFRTPEDKAAIGRVVVGTLTLLLSSTGISHLLNGSPHQHLWCKSPPSPSPKPLAVNVKLDMDWMIFSPVAKIWLSGFFM